jgi:hypothetical protein
MCTVVKTNPQKLVFSTQCCGFYAAKILAGNSAAQVIGVTKKGTFIQTEGHQILFVSGEVFCGPLTINLSSMINFKSLFSLGEKCALQKDRIVFNNVTILIEANTPIWQPPPIYFTEEGWQDVYHRFKHLTATLVTAYQGGMFLPFLEKALRRSAGEYSSRALYEENLSGLLPSLESDQPGDLSQRLLGLIGLGSGLTPAGDDFLVGFLLASHYLNQIAPSSASEKELQDHIVLTARRKTTTLSAALMQCAAEGAADERLMNALDWLAQANADIQQIRADLLSYGSSSGIDSFAGILAAILLFSTQSP